MNFRAMAIGFGLILSACDTTGPIEAADSVILVDLPSGSWPAITRDLKAVGQVREEVWDWPSGTLRAVRTGRGRYYPTDFSDPSDFAEFVGYWPTFVRSDIDPRQIRTGKNAIGDFQYATAEKRGRICFYMLQGLPEHHSARFEAPDEAESSSGYITFYQCASNASTTNAELEARGLTLAEALKRKW